MGSKKGMKKIMAVIAKLVTFGSNAKNVETNRRSRRLHATAGTVKNAELKIMRPRLRFTNSQLNKLNKQASLCGISLNEFIVSRLNED